MICEFEFEKTRINSVPGARSYGFVLLGLLGIKGMKTDGKKNIDCVLKLANSLGSISEN